MTRELIGLIPAAGKGVRLGLPYPKELYPIIQDNRYKPVSQYVIENMVASGIEHIVIVINETKHQLVGYFGNGSRFNCHISYVVQEQVDDSKRSTSPGLGHALDSAYHLIAGKTVCFGMADTIMTPKPIFARLMDSQQPSDQVVLGLYETQHPEKFGMVEMGQDCQVLKIVDKPHQTKLVYMWGLILWEPAFTDHLHECITSTTVSDFAQVMNLAIQKGLTFRGSIIHDGDYADLGTYDEIRELEKRYRAD